MGSHRDRLDPEALTLGPLARGALALRVLPARVRPGPLRRAGGGWFGGYAFDAASALGPPQPGDVGAGLPAAAGIGA